MITADDQLSHPCRDTCSGWEAGREYERQTQGTHTPEYMSKLRTVDKLRNMLKKAETERDRLAKALEYAKNVLCDETPEPDWYETLERLERGSEHGENASVRGEKEHGED